MISRMSNSPLAGILLEEIVELGVIQKVRPDKFALGC
jgi:hypothetical protein